MPVTLHYMEHKARRQNKIIALDETNNSFYVCSMRCNRRNLVRLAGHYRRLELGFFCVYCGEDATTRDHFIPVSVAAMYAGLALVSPSAKVTLPCCHDCNCRAGAKVFKTVGAKRRYI